ncbi:hypothetical protein AMATHDRAFT_76844 [Amanita thiersii Skay4041]|uniref:Arf-GAP domain-containing protein n=1 Tax=Amanita thiersii Skay4041 TaxID=703135 RepID=A0A2A9NDR7_9AGAR|nr:hypothetical protein AMATHDRAFT_76844 [Amanita thiersii Skay4041]
MTRQDKITTERHAKTLRELVKRPENKVCADCKRNDPRWASWNLGVFLCIRCSGIHRGMGTHISKVKSVDLDVWTPEQMESIVKWGNHLANLYWEAHLKPGHIPQDHKMESFIRSKYESRRWAMDGPPPSDPSTLEQASSVPQSEPLTQQPATPSPAPPTRSTHATNNSMSGSRPPLPLTTRQPLPHPLLSANFTQSNKCTQPAPQVTMPQAAPKPMATAPQNDLFSLDFHAPPPATTQNSLAQQPMKDVKQDILSLFSKPPSLPTHAGTPSHDAFAIPQAGVSPWASSTTSQQPVTSMIGTAGVGAWGTSSGWTGAGNSTTLPTQQSVWASAGAASLPSQPQNLFNTNDIWGSTGPQAATSQDLLNTNSTQSRKKDDVFGDLWSGFK